MTQEEKQLLLKDLCARLPYVIICNDIHGDSIVTYIDIEKACVYLPDFDECRGIDDIKPYLRPMSSMTEEEFLVYEETRIWKYVDDCHYEYFDTLETFDWLNEHHFDYRGLIEKGLALEAPADMYKND